MTTYFKFLSTLFVALIVFSSCSKSPEEKAKVLAENEIKKTLNFPDSYSLADIKTDSAFAPYDSPEFIDLCKKLAEIAKELDKVKIEIELAKTAASIWSDPYTTFSRNENSKANESLSEALDKEKQLNAKGKEITDKMKRMSTKKPEFIGYKSDVSYRAKDNGDIVLMSKAFLLFDKDVEKVKYICQDVDYNNYKGFLEAIQQMNSK